MSRREIVTLAEKATDAAEQQWSRAFDLVVKDRWVNGCSVYTDRTAIISRLHDLEAAAVAARRALEAVPWPTDADYGES
jgi:hypothetical protein